LDGSAPSKQPAHSFLAMGLVVMAAMAAVACSSAQVIDNGQGGSSGTRRWRQGRQQLGLSSGAGGGIVINTAVPDANLGVDRPAAAAAATASWSATRAATTATP
jgi:hypothetical protein